MTLRDYAIAWLLGVIAAALGLGDDWLVALLAGLILGAGFILSRQPRYAVAGALLAAVFLAGFAVYLWSRPSGAITGIALANDREAVSIRGTLIEEPEQRDTSQRLHLRVEAVQDKGGAWQRTSGGVQVTTRLFPRFRYGDVLELRGKLQTPPSFDGFDYREYLARQGIQSLSSFPTLRRVGSGGGSDIVRVLTGVRRSMGVSLERSLPEPESALARGILLGERASIPKDLTDDFNAAGISHIVAISGYNVMLVAGFALATLSWVIGRRPATVGAMGVVVLFALFVGATPSVLRAAVMAQVLLGASLAGRPNSAGGAVFLAGAVLTAWQPSIIKDVLFQLSFAATVGIVLLAKPLEQRLRALLPGATAALAEPAGVTIAASLAAQPIIAINFGRLSLVALPANLLALSSFPLIMLGSFVTSVAGLASIGLGRLVGEVTYLPLAYLIWVGRSMARLQGSPLMASGLTSLDASLIYGATFLLAFVIARLWRRPASNPAVPRLSPALWASLAVLLIAAFVWRDTLAAAPRELRVSVLDVGQGDSILIQTPKGQRILVDGGPGTNLLNQALGRELPASVHRIDLMVLTHGDEDHVAGLVSVLDRYNVSTVLTTPSQAGNGAYREWRNDVSRRGIPLRLARAGEWIDLGDGAHIEVLGPPERLLTGTSQDLNNSSVVLRLVYGQISFLLTGDLASDGEQAVLNGGGAIQSTVLKVGHHGSDGSSTAPFLAAVQPRLAVISVGADNNYGQPSPSTRQRLRDTPVLRTAEDGDVRMSTDGKRLRVDVQRGSRHLAEAAAE